MFDKHVYAPRMISESVTRHVHEHRAPTDESVRLLREMEEKAVGEVVKAIRLENSPIDAVLHVHHNIASADIEYRIIYKLGGERRVVDHSEPYFYDSYEERSKRIRNVRDALAKDIANLLSESFIRNLEKADKV